MFYLASASSSRKYLLDMMQIPYVAIGHQADETTCDWGLPLETLVCTIAEKKMEFARMPKGMQDKEKIFVLTADTLSMDSVGTIHGKPVSVQDAITKIEAMRSGARVSTGFCVDVKEWNGDCWQKTKRILKSVSAECVFDVPEHWIQHYLDHSPALHVSGGVAIEEYGLQFLKSVSGSYTTIVGLPLFELRQVLDELGFFEFV